MDSVTAVAIIIASLTSSGVAITLTVLVIRGGLRLISKVENLGNQLDIISEQVKDLTAAVNELRAEVQQSTQTLAALANLTHDTDGRTVFQAPPAVSR